MESAIQEMLVQSRGMKIDWSLNHIHTCANEVQTIGLVVQESGFSFVLRFGYPNDSSHWDYVIASTRGNEPFAETLNRAYVLFHRLIPDFKAQLQAQDRKSTRLNSSPQCATSYAVFCLQKKTHTKK